MVGRREMMRWGVHVVVGVHMRWRVEVVIGTLLIFLYEVEREWEGD